MTMVVKNTGSYWGENDSRLYILCLSCNLVCFVHHYKSKLCLGKKSDSYKNYRCKGVTRYVFLNLGEFPTMQLRCSRLPDILTNWNSHHSKIKELWTQKYNTHILHPLRQSWGLFLKILKRLPDMSIYKTVLRFPWYKYCETSRCNFFFSLSPSWAACIGFMLC